MDNELQELIPSLLKSILLILWAERMDWFFGIDMGIYTDPEQPAIAPNGFLSLNVERFFDEELRLSYLLWEEKVPPILAIEVVSQTIRGEYTHILHQFIDTRFKSRLIQAPSPEMPVALGSALLLSEAS